MTGMSQVGFLKIISSFEQWGYSRTITELEICWTCLIPFTSVGMMAHGSNPPTSDYPFPGFSMLYIIWGSHISDFQSPSISSCYDSQTLLKNEGKFTPEFTDECGCPTSGLLQTMREVTEESKRLRCDLNYQQNDEGNGKISENDRLQEIRVWRWKVVTIRCAVTVYIHFFILGQLWSLMYLHRNFQIQHKALIWLTVLNFSNPSWTEQYAVI